MIVFGPGGTFLLKSYSYRPGGIWPVRISGPPNFAAIYKLCCYLLHFRPSPIRGGPNPCALPIESASGPFGGLGEGRENLGGNRADGLPAWFRLPWAAPGGGSGPVHTGTWPASHGALLIWLPFRSCYYACVCRCRACYGDGRCRAPTARREYEKRLWRGGTLPKASSLFIPAGGVRPGS